MNEIGATKRVGVIGATSFVGSCLLPRMVQAGWQVTAFSRKIVERKNNGVEWRQLAPAPSLPVSHHGAEDKPSNIFLGDMEVIPYWLCVAPIWILADHFDMLLAHGVRRVVSLSSTSRFTKSDSTDPEEQAIAERLAAAEAGVRAWAEAHGVEWVILRPTLIYGLGQDKNICEIARIIRRFGFFPLLGKARGLRQPIHAADVAEACLSALQTPCAANRDYNISGGETLTYRDMVARVFSALGSPPRLLSIPLWAFRLAVAILRCLPRYRKWSPAMAERMSHDLVFDRSEATRDLDFQPRKFVLLPEDLQP